MFCSMCVLSWHGGVDVRRLVLIAGFGAALAAAGSSAVLALEEQRAPMPVPQQTQPSDAPKAGVQDAAPAAKPDAGTEIRIPGLGKLGTLPKMDFGLELLYGASEDKSTTSPEQLPEENDQRDLMIRGSVKHRF